jgi:hypothetical protein
MHRSPDMARTRWSEGGKVGRMVGHYRYAVTRLALLAGVVGPPLFVATFLIEGATRRGYDPIRLQVSYLSLSDQGWMQIANFCLSGALAIFFAWGLRQALRSGRVSFWAPLLIATYGLGLIVSGVFVTDAAFGYPPGTPNGAERVTTFHGVLHVIPGTPLTFGSLILAEVVMAWHFWRDRTTRKWAIFSLASLVLFVAPPFFIDDTSIGLSQRISIIVLEVWLTVIAARFLILTARSGEARPG